MTKIFFSPLSFVAVFGSGIRDPGSGILDPGSGMGKNQDPGSGIGDKHPRSATLDCWNVLFHGGIVGLYEL
jgi:hypothetical protein